MKKEEIKKRHEYLKELKEKYAKGEISKEVFYNYILTELKSDTTEERFSWSNLFGRKKKKTTAPLPSINDLTKPTISKKSSLPNTISQEILNNLDTFEKSKGFIKNNLTIHTVAKKLQTNSRYLSRTINIHKEKSFTRYINDLRIDYLIEVLKQGSDYNNYTIKAIGKEIGFNTADAFSKAFYKKMGIYPSQFILDLSKEEK